MSGRTLPRVLPRTLPRVLPRSPTSPPTPTSYLELLPCAGARRRTVSQNLSWTGSSGPASWPRAALASGPTSAKMSMLGEISY